MILIAAFISLIACSIAFHWAAWRRFDECDARCKALEAKLAELESETTKELDGQFDLAKRLERGLGLLEARVDRIDGKPARPADPANYVNRTYPKGPNEL